MIVVGAWPPLLGAGVVATLSMLVAAIVKWPIVGLYLCTVPIVFLWEAPSSMLLVSIAGIQIYLLDVVSLTLITATPFILAKSREGRSGQTPWWWLALAFAVSVVAGMVLLGVSTAVVEARQEIAFCAVLCWTMSVEWRNQGASVERWAFVTAWLVIVAAAYHALTTGIGEAGTFVDAIDGGQVGRILVSGQALALVLLVWFCVARSTSRMKWLLVVVALVTLVASQQRTVWVVTLVGAAVALVFARRKTTWLALVGWCALLATALTYSGAFGQVSPLIESAANAGTYEGRLYSWSQLVGQAFQRGLLSVLFGSPYGSGYERIERNGQTAFFNPHNWYLTLFLRVGIVGLALFAVGVAGLVRRQLRTQATRLELAGTAGLLVYGWTYNLSFIAALFLGLYIVSASSGREVRHVTKRLALRAPRHA